MNDALLSFFVVQGYGEEQREKKEHYGERYRWLTRFTKNVHSGENASEDANTFL